jgi:hypothetical protein
MLAPTFVFPTVVSPARVDNGTKLSVPSVVVDMTSMTTIAYHPLPPLPLVHSSSVITAEPGPYDVVCGRGKGSYNRPGNRLFRELVLEYVPEYMGARSKLDKSIVLNSIIERVQRQGNGTALFVKYDRRSKKWFEIGDDVAREKVGHALREAINAPPSTQPMRSATDHTQEVETCTVFFDSYIAQSLLEADEKDLSVLWRNHQQFLLGFLESSDSATVVSF